MKFKIKHADLLRQMWNGDHSPHTEFIEFILEGTPVGDENCQRCLTGRCKYHQQGTPVEEEKPAFSHYGSDKVAGKPLDEEKTYHCRVYPTEGWHEVGCPHMDRAEKVEKKIEAVLIELRDTLIKLL